MGNCGSKEGEIPTPEEYETPRALLAIAEIEDKPTMFDQFIKLQEIFDEDENLFYQILLTDIPKWMPVVYTPTIGEVCQRFGEVSKHLKKDRGLTISRADLGNMEALFKKWGDGDAKDDGIHRHGIDCICFTDGERILGLGDLGVFGMGIPVGKLVLYSILGGIRPHSCLPVTIDVGCNRVELRNQDDYYGLKQDRLRGEEFEELIEDFIESAKKYYGDATLFQFEDFGNSTAFGLLDKWRDRCCCFNDDIQGTAAVALAGMLAALKVDGVASNLADHKLLFLGAGEAGCGIGELCALWMIEREGISKEDAYSKLWFVDSRGLVVKDRSTGGLAHHKLPFAHEHEEVPGKFIDQVNVVKPTAIIGVSTIGGAFTQEVLEKMAELNEVPIIAALSNPTSKAECTAEDAYKFTKDKCIFTSGSPFPQYTSGDLVRKPGQGNNAYIFPGLGLGVIAIGAKTIPEYLFLKAAESLAQQVTKTDFKYGRMYPDPLNMRAVSSKIAGDVAELCVEKGINTVEKPSGMNYQKWCETFMWTPPPPQ